MDLRPVKSAFDHPNWKGRSVAGGSLSPTATAQIANISCRGAFANPASLDKVHG
jgi:hypothetical protein